MESGDFLNLPHQEQYLVSFYFTVTTITTVGYGDISISTPMERTFCTLIMIIGVFSFSFVSGALASIMQNYDSQNAHRKEQLAMLNKILKEYELPLDLYASLKQSLSIKNNKDFEEMHKFLEDLPYKLKIDVSVHIYERTYKSILFLKCKSRSFIAWICPLLKPYAVTEN